MTKTEKATFAAGCFWGVEEMFRTTPGVLSTRVGYTGGNFKDPTYEDVCAGVTGHAEAVEITFDPEKVTYQKLLEIFWKSHNPSISFGKRDHYYQYRSAIFYHSEEQKEKAEKAKVELEKSGRFLNPIATLIEPASEFYPAEDYHQKFLMKRGQGSCHF